MSVPVTLSELERWGMIVNIFWQISVIMLERFYVRHTVTKFGKITQVGRNIFLEGQPRPHPKGVGTQIFRTPYIHPGGLTKNIE